MNSRLSIRSRPGRFQRTGPSRASSGGGGSSGFFGEVAATRELWAEDPDQTDPGDGELITTWRDNGSEGGDWTGGNGLRWVDGSTVGINGHPAFDHRDNAQRVMTSPLAGREFTLPYTFVVVCQFDTSGTGYIFDDRQSHQNVATYRKAGDTVDIYGGSTGVLATSGAIANEAVAVIEAVYDGSGSLIRINGAEVTGGNASNTVDGFKLGTSYGNTYGMDGLISYWCFVEASAPGDIDGYSDWVDSINTYYGVS